MRRLVIALALLFGVGIANAQTMSEAEVDTLSRSAATIMADMINRSLANLEGTGVAIDDSVFNATLLKALQGQPTGVNTEQAGKYIEKMVARMHQQYVDQQKDFLAKMATVKGAKVLPDGVIIITEKAGKGVKPTADQSVKLNYVGRLSNGTEFDNTNGQPVTFKVKDLVPGFTEGLENMQAGGKYRLIIPSDKAYGTNGAGGVIPGDSALDFTIELLSIE